MIYKDFDLPVRHQPKGLDYVPPKARDEEEAMRRRLMPAGTLMADQQCDGIAITADILTGLEDPRDLAFASRLLGASALNTSWYLFARNASVMRRRLKLPNLTVPEDDVRPDTLELIQSRDLRLEDVRGRSRTYASIVAFGFGEMLLDNHRNRLGRNIGNSALAIATVDLGDVFTFGSSDDFEVQDAVRRRALRTLTDARELGVELHTAPSLAQLADPDSDLSVFWRRNAPNGALMAYEQAYEERAA